MRMSCIQSANQRIQSLNVLIICKYNNKQRIMLFAAKPLSQSKYKASKTPQVDAFLADFSGSNVKNVGLSLNKIIRQKHGRKFVQKQSRQLHNSIAGNYCPLRTSHKWEADDKKTENSRTNFTIYEQTRKSKLKRHTYNNQCYSSEREEESDNEATFSRDPKAKRSCIGPQAARTQEAVKRNAIERRVFQEKRQENMNNHYQQEFDREILQPKSRSRKYSIHSKLIPIQFNEDLIKKPSLVDLIKKFKFENLKTTNLPSPHSQEYYDEVKRFNDSAAKTHGKKDFLYFREKNGTFYNDIQKKLSKKASRDLIKTKRKSRERAGDQLTIKKMNSFLSPWGTIADHYYLHQSPLE